MVFNDGVSQPTSAYTLPSDTNLTFNPAPPNSSAIKVLHLGLAGNGMNNLVEDTSPQLGGALDFNGHKFTNHILQSQHDTYDIGSAEFKIRDMYLGSNTLYMGDDATIKAEGTAIVVQDLKTGDLHLDNTHRDGNSVDGTSGSWTFEEGDENLFLLNNITGKKYKINLTEIE